MNRYSIGVLSCVAFSLLLSLPSAGLAQIHGICARCGEWVKLSDDGVGLNRKAFVLCGKCLRRCNEEQRQRYDDLGDDRLHNYERARQNYADGFAAADQAFKDYVDSKTGGFNVDNDREYQDLKSARDRAEQGLKTQEQLIKDLLDARSDLVGEISSP
jgi:hypothetical protein